jgi:ketosteroid isomerase-like protein
MRLPLLAALAFAALLAAAPAAADVVPGVPSAETEIASVLGRWDRARAQRDARVLAEIMAEDFAATWAEGGRLTRADILAGRAPEAGARLIYREDIAVTVAGGSATFTSRVIRIGTALGPDRAEISRETVTLRRERDRWRLVGSRARRDR